MCVFRDLLPIVEHGTRHDFSSEVSRRTSFQRVADDLWVW